MLASACFCRFGRRLTSVLGFLQEELLDLVTNFTIRKLDVVLGGAIVVHEREETIVGDVELWHMLGFRLEGRRTDIDLQADIPGDERWGRPCCEWTGRDLQASCR